MAVSTDMDRARFWLMFNLVYIRLFSKAVIWTDGLQHAVVHRLSPSQAQSLAFPFF